MKTDTTTEQAKHTGVSERIVIALIREGLVAGNVHSERVENYKRIQAILDNDPAVNAHQELVAACRDAERALLGLKNQCSDSEWEEGWQDLPDTLRKLTALLSKLGGAK